MPPSRAARGAGRRARSTCAVDRVSMRHTHARARGAGSEMRFVGARKKVCVEHRIEVLCVRVSETSLSHQTPLHYAHFEVL